MEDFYTNPTYEYHDSDSPFFDKSRLSAIQRLVAERVASDLARYGKGKYYAIDGKIVYVPEGV